MKVIVRYSEPCPNLGDMTNSLWCWYCYENLRKRASHRGHRFCSGTSRRAAERTRGGYMEILAMKREQQEKQGKASKYHPPGDAFWDTYPNLAVQLSDQWWDDGAPRDCPQLSLRVYVDTVQGSLVDIDKRRSTTTTARTLSEVLGLMEAFCTTGSIPWRSWGAKKK